MVRLLRLLTTILWAFVVSDMSNAIRISNCNIIDSIKIIELNGVLPIYCYGSGDNTSTITWILLDDNGSSKFLAKCRGLNNCVASYNSYFLEVYRSTVTYSSISFHNFRQEFSGSGLIVCTETNSTSNVSASCPLKMTRAQIRSCEAGLANQGVSCDHATFPSSIVSWTIQMYSGQTLNLGYCTGQDQCNSPLSPNVTLYRQISVSSVDFRNGFINRDMTQLICSYTFNGDTDEDNCAVNIYHRPRVENCRVEITHHNWSLILSCDLTNVISNREQYDFRVFELFNVLKRNKSFPANKFTSDGNISYRRGLQSYTIYTRNRQYYTGRLVYSWPLSPLPGSYSGFRIYMYPGGYTEEISKKFNITLPAAPTHNCTAVDYISTSRQQTCVCTTKFIGSPSGRLTWVIEDSLLAAGDYGVNQLLFPFGNLTAEQSAQTAVCQLDWVKPLYAASQSNIHGESEADRSRQQLKAAAIAGWTLLGVVVILLMIRFIMVRQGRTVLCPDRNPTYDSVRRRTNNEEARNYTGLNFRAEASSNNIIGQDEGVTCPSPVYQNMALPGDDIGAHM